MKTVSDEWEEKNKELDELPCDYNFIIDNIYFKKFIISPFKMNTYIMHNEVTVLRSFINAWDKNILEVGAGYGNFCRCLHDRVQVEDYTILDTKSMIRFSKSFLAHYDIPCTFVESDRYKDLFDKKFDLLVSNICLSELPVDYREDLLNGVLPNCDSVFIIDSGYVGFSSWLEQKITKFFTDVCFLEIPDLVSAQKNQRIFSGNK